MKKLVILLVFLSFSCSDDSGDDVDCTLENVAGLVVNVKDAHTGTALKEGVTVVAIDGSYSENLKFLTGFSGFTGAYERTGNYVVTVSKEGYKVFTTQTITVYSNRCHVITKEVTVGLEPE